MARGDRKLTIVLAGDAKGAMGAFDEAGKGADGLGSKFQNLGKVAAVGIAALGAGVAAAAVGLFKIGETFDEAYDKIRVGTGATGEALEGLKSDFKEVVKSVPADFGAAGDAVATLSRRFNVTGEDLQFLSKNFLELSRITGTDLTANMAAGSDALLNWDVAAKDAATPLNELFRASQLSGVSFETLAKQLADNGAVLRGLGFDMGQATTLVAGLGKAGIDTGDVMPALSKALATAAKSGKDAETVYKETVKAIKTAGTDVEAAGIAMEVFGAKAGPRLSQLIREGSLSFDLLGESIAEGSDTILQAGQDTQDFGEKWQMIKNRVFVALEPLAMKLFDAIGKAMDKLGPKVEQLSAWFSENLPKAVAAASPWVERLAKAVAVVAKGIVTLGTYLVEHKRVLLALAIGISGVLIPAFVAWAVSAAAAAVATIAAAAPFIVVGAAIAGFAYLVITHWDTIKAATQAVWDFIKTAVGTAVDFVTSLFLNFTVPGLIIKHFDTIRGVIDSFISFFAELPGRISAIASGMWNGIVTAFKAAINTVIGFWNSLRIPSFKIGGWDIPGPGPNVPSFNTPEINFPDIPTLARGGIVVAGDNPSGIEAIVPLERAGQMGFGGGTTIIVENRGWIGSEAQLRQWLMAQLEEAARRGGKFGPATRRALA